MAGFGDPGDYFGGPGAPFGVILGVLGLHVGSFWGSGGTPGRLRRAVASKDRWCLLAPPHFKRFLRPKGAQQVPKMELKSVIKRFKNRSTFWLDF